jgi:hypothetical protein
MNYSIIQTLFSFLTCSWSNVVGTVVFCLTTWCLLAFLKKQSKKTSQKRLFEIHILIRANDEGLLSSLRAWHELNKQSLSTMGYENSRIMATRTVVGNFPVQPMITCVVYTTSHAEAINLRKKLSDILVSALQTDNARGKTEEVISRGKTEEVIARGKTEEVIARGKTEEVIARGKTEEVIARGKTEEVIARGKTEEVIARGKTEEVIARGKTEEVIARGNLRLNIFEMFK